MWQPQLEIERLSVEYFDCAAQNFHRRTHECNVNVFMSLCNAYEPLF